MKKNRQDMATRAPVEAAARGIHLPLEAAGPAAICRRRGMNLRIEFE
jgi:hypothetical protein